MYGTILSSCERAWNVPTSCFPLFQQYLIAKVTIPKTNTSELTTIAKINQEENVPQQTKSLEQVLFELQDSLIHCALHSLNLFRSVFWQQGYSLMSQ